MTAWIAREMRRLSLASASAETVALSVAFGLALGVFPVYGCPTLLCMAVAVLFRLHVPLLHSINLVTSPLQLALIVPFHKLGDRVLPASAAWAVPGHWQLALTVCGFTSRVVAGWFLVCAPLAFTLYVGLTFALRRYGPLRGAPADWRKIALTRATVRARTG